MANKTEDPFGSKSQLPLTLKTAGGASQVELPLQQQPHQKQQHSTKGAADKAPPDKDATEQRRENKKDAEQGEETPKKWHSTLKEKFVAGWRRFVLWFKAVYLIRKAYVPGDTCRFIWQKVPEIKRSFVYYRIAHTIGNLLTFCISCFHISTPYRKQFCAERGVLCIGPYMRMQYQWFFYATSWGMMFNFIQSAWGLVLTLRLYLRQRRAQKMARDIENPDVDGAIDQPSAQKKIKNGDRPWMRKSKSPQVRDSKSPSYRSVEVAQSKDAGLTKPSILSAESRASPESVGSKKQQEPKASTTQHGKQTTGRDGTSPEAGGTSSMTALAQDKKQSTGPAWLKSAVSKVKLVKKLSREAGPSLSPESGAGPSATKEHRIFSATGFYWGLHSYCVCSSLLIDTTYWTLIWPYLPTRPHVHLIQVNEHALNLPLMITDYCLVAFPVDLSHLWFTTAISFIYVTVNCMYFFAGGLNYDRTTDYLYPFLDWKTPGKALAFGTLLTMVTAVLLLVLLGIDHYKFKLRPKALLNNTQKDPSPTNVFVK